MEDEVGIVVVFVVKDQDSNEVVIKNGTGNLSRAVGKRNFTLVVLVI